jgi:CPA2 family monovalent cation:H+ antiporter-2
VYDGHEFLKALTMVLCVAAVTTLLFQRLRQPVVLGYILAGLIIGPHVPIPLVADPHIVHVLSELGVILLMFSLGLEFSLRKLLKVGPTAGLTAVIQSSVMIWLGFITGRAFGWTVRESIFAGAIIAISSTTIIAKAFDEQRVRGGLRELVVGILIVEDLIAIVLMAVLTAVATGGDLTAGDLMSTTGRLLAFLAGLLAIGMLVVPRAVRAIVRLDRPETLVIASIGLCFAVALLAQSFGYSVALGAFLAGSLVAESGEEKRVERLVEPVRDVFAAIFFVSVGMLIEPELIVRHGAAIAVLTAVVIAGKILSVSFGAFLTGRGTRTSIRAGMSLAQIGEFSFIIAGLGLSLDATRNFLYPVAVTVSAITTLTTPWLIRAAGPTASWVDRRLPPALQTFASLYESWLEQIRKPRPQGDRTEVPRLIGLLLLDATVLIAVLIGTSVSLAEMTGWVVRTFAFDRGLARWLVVGAAAALSAPFCVGIVRVTQKLGVTLADRVLPETGAGRVDLATAPRRALVVTLQLGVVLLVGAPIVALTQPFLPGLAAAIALGLVLVLLGIAFWRSAENLEGHVRAGAQVIVEALASQSRAQSAEGVKYSLDAVHELLPGLGELVPIRLEPGSPGVGRTLAQLDVRGLTGATVLAINRGEQGVVVPTAHEVLLEGDVLALSGSHDAVSAAIALFGAPP